MTQKVILFIYIYPPFPSTDKLGKMAFGMASNLFHLRHNFLTRKCPSLLPTRHFLKHTEIYISSEMIAYAPQDILPNLPVLVRLGIYEKYREYFSFLLPSNSESPVALYRTTWKACHGDTGAKLPYESPPPSSTWPYRASCGDTDLLELSTFVYSDCLLSGWSNVKFLLYLLIVIILGQEYIT